MTALAAGNERDRAPREERVGEARLAGPAGAGRDAPPLTAEQQKRFDAGAEIYKNICLGCHQEDGRGKDKLGANLVDSPFVTAADASASIRILVGGKEGPIGLMPPLGPALSDEQIAAALTYIRRAWGHTGGGGRSAERHGSAGPVEGRARGRGPIRSCRPPAAAAAAAASELEHVHEPAARRGGRAAIPVAAERQTRLRRHQIRMRPCREAASRSSRWRASRP